MQQLRRGGLRFTVVRRAPHASRPLPLRVRAERLAWQLDVHWPFAAQLCACPTWPERRKARCLRIRDGYPCVLT